MATQTTADFRAGARNSALSTMVDADDELGRLFNNLERKNLAFAAMQACNATAFAVREEWKREAGKVFDRPTPFTTNAILYAKATRERLYADVYIRDEAFAGTPPSLYLRPEVEGGQRKAKGFEVLLQRAGQMPAGMFAVPGSGVNLDPFGNVPASLHQQVLSQLQARRDPLANETATSRTRRRKATKRSKGRRDFFAVTKKEGGLTPGIYEHLTLQFGNAVRKIFHYVRFARYKPRFDIYAYTERTWNKLMPFYFKRELEKAMQSSKSGGDA